MDLGEGGASVRLEPATALVPGVRLPAFTLEVEGERRPVAGATVRYLSALDDGALRAGLRFEEGETERDSFRELKRHTASGGLATRLSRTVSMLGGKVASFVRRPGRNEEGGIEVVRFRNKRGDTVAGILDANFDTSDPAIRPDVAVVIAPAILKRKEVFGLLARTVLDDLDRDGRKVVTLRFDASHIVGESTMNPKLVAEGRPYYNWTFGHLGDDMAASLRYLQRRFRPAKRALVSVSLSAIPARKVAVECIDAPVDLWIAPYGCPDAQDVLRNYLAGLDLFEVYRQGEGPETILIHGRPIRGDALYGQAMEAGLAFLEDGRRDLARLQAPVVWILGTYDCWVTRSRVRALLDAPGGGVREVFECATGHVLKSGAEAIELFKLVAESMSKHLFGADRPAREPNLARFARQSESEWGRVRRLELADAEGFWKEHLFGVQGDDVGYDILLDHPEYPRFLARQAELLDPRPGEDLADFGCGTGNFLLAMLDACRAAGGAPASLTFLDLVPEAIERTREKLLTDCALRGLPAPEHRGLVADLEVSRLAVIADFLAGRLHGVEGLVHRVEGLPFATARKLAARLRPRAARHPPRRPGGPGPGARALPDPGGPRGGDRAGDQPRRPLPARRRAAGGPPARRASGPGGLHGAPPALPPPPLRRSHAAAPARPAGRFFRPHRLVAGPAVPLRPAGGPARDAPAAQARRHAGGLLPAAELRPLQALHRGGRHPGPAGGGRRFPGRPQAGGAAPLRQHGQPPHRAGGGRPLPFPGLRRRWRP